MIAKSTLDSGVRILTEAVPEARSVSVGVWVDVGSRHEAPEQAGISHLVEHMVFKGTAQRSMHQIARRMEDVGGFLNAFTSKEHTCYQARALHSYLDRALDTTCDLVCKPIFPEAELDKERTVVLEEMKMYEDAPEDHIFDKFESIVFPNHGLGRPVIGFPDTITALQRTQLCDFVREHYTPDRIVVSAVGNLQHDDVVHHVGEQFADLRVSNGPMSTQTRPDYAPAELIENRSVQQAHLVVGRRGFSINSRRYSSFRVLNTVLGGGMSSRLSQNIREKFGFCYNIFSFFNMHSDCGDFGVYMGAEASKLDQAQDLIFYELDKLRQTPLKQKTLQRAKNQLKGSLIMDLEHLTSRMQRLARQELMLGRQIATDEYLADIDRVRAADVQDLAQELFDPSQFSRVVFLPQPN